MRRRRRLAGVVGLVASPAPAIVGVLFDVGLRRGPTSVLVAAPAGEAAARDKKRRVGARESPCGGADGNADGGGGKRTQRASLLALLGICASTERRRVLRSQGLVQQIIDAILVLDIDDPPCGIAAGALLFVLASDMRFSFSVACCCTASLVMLIRDKATFGS
uniref:Wings apart-like protein C-terminal domain-containing protein n=1 Tax=Zea mays TaxID=4577 RepID=A0A804LSC6_MAIZE